MASDEYWNKTNEEWLDILMKGWEKQSWIKKNKRSKGWDLNKK
ncbi:MAG: hypothetical protein ACTSXD_11610 [Candidatus Heimdallarchaeaceae archaeon]